MKLFHVNSSKRIRIALISTVVFVTLIGLLIVLSETSACSFFRGRCSYDPRSEHPNSIFMEPAEPYIVHYIEDYAKQNGTFPPGATGAIDTITPLRVTAGGFYTDWHVVVKLLVQITYTDGSQRDLRFETMEKSASSLFNIENTTFFARFRPIEECNEEPVGLWNCR